MSANAAEGNASLIVFVITTVFGFFGWLVRTGTGILKKLREHDQEIGDLKKQMLAKDGLQGKVDSIATDLSVLTATVNSIKDGREEDHDLLQALNTHNAQTTGRLETVIDLLRAGEIRPKSSGR